MKGLEVNFCCAHGVKDKGMTEQYTQKGRYDVIDHTGYKVGEVVKGVFYEGAPDYRQAIWTVTHVGNDDGLTIVRDDGAVFKLVPQEKS